MKLVHASLSGRKDLESSFNHSGGPVKLQFKCQQRSRMQFSPLWKSCGACGGFI